MTFCLTLPFPYLFDILKLLDDLLCLLLRFMGKRAELRCCSRVVFRIWFTFSDEEIKINHFRTNWICRPCSIEAILIKIVTKINTKVEEIDRNDECQKINSEMSPMWTSKQHRWALPVILFLAHAPPSMIFISFHSIFQWRCNNDRA